MRLFAYELRANERYQHLTRSGPECSEIARAFSHWATATDVQDEAPRVRQGGSCATAWQEWRRREMQVMGTAMELEMVRAELEKAGVMVPK